MSHIKNLEKVLKNWVLGDCDPKDLRFLQISTKKRGLIPGASSSQIPYLDIVDNRTFFSPLMHVF